ncbi:formylglycine-generating enzyme family protein [bacterium AH-315-L15]|nr:formylglycine-generating enzyme family protein [bacterium AH-315-L15]
MGATLSFNPIGTHIRNHQRSPLSATFIFFFLSFFLTACLFKTPEPSKRRHLENSTAPTQTIKGTEGMVWIPSGNFIMGTDEVDEKNEGMQLGFPQPWFEDERPLVMIDLKGYTLDRTEVTQANYLKFIRATGHRQPAHWRHGSYKVGTENHPVTFVDWYDANDYCRWLGKRLPSEAEWEKAARGPDGRRYPWGNRFELSRAYLSPASDVLKKTAPVGQYPEGASPYGVLDMVGNVWEWTDSWYLPYSGSILRKPEFGMKHRVVRGLSFHSLGHYSGKAYPRVLEIYARASTRSYDPPSERLGDLGFRCALSREGN